ncbi:MAG TPA: hypothetical protein VHY10_18565 [Xanthobacteraceae bacterium]|nr:hypothetical protein [Xanthobacteraceae bacterium]
MLRITVSRIRIFFAVMGCAVLGTSLIDWAQSLRVAESGYAWVQANSPLAPAVETAEIWRASARCMRPFFVDAVLRSKARLNAYYDLVPPEVRAARSSAATPHDTTYHLVADRQDGGSENAAQLERGAMLHARYAEWYANVFKLEIDEHQWEERLNNVADKSVTVGEGTRRSTAGRGSALNDAAGDFDRNILGLLGLNGFPADLEAALRARCVGIIPVKKVFKSPTYASEFWRWPVEYPATFSFGLELLLIAIFFVPIDLWIATGNTRAAWQHVAEVTARLAARMHSYIRACAVRFLNVLLRFIRATALGTCAIFTARINSGAAVGQIHFVAKLAKVKFPRQLVPVADGSTLGKSIAWIKRAGAHRLRDGFA